MPLMSFSAERGKEVMGTIFQLHLSKADRMDSQTEQWCQLLPAQFHSLFVFPLCLHSCGVASFLEWPDLPLHRQQVKNTGWRWRCLFAQREGIPQKCHDVDEAPSYGCTGRKSISSHLLGHKEGTLHRSRGSTWFSWTVLPVENISPWLLFKTVFGSWNLQLRERCLSDWSMLLVMGLISDLGLRIALKFQEKNEAIPIDGNPASALAKEVILPLSICAECQF